MAKRKGMGSHHSSSAGKDEWLTPPEITNELGPFDLDPCSPVNRPWDTAKTHYTVWDDGLAQEWHGHVWCNPPYGSETGKWLSKLADHGDGLALIFARTETADFTKYVWGRADAILFITSRLYFYHVSGIRADANGGAPSCLVAYGPKAVKSLERCSIKGAYIKNWFCDA